MKTFNQDNSWAKLFIIAILLWGISGLIVYFMLPNFTVRGQFGDMFGVVNSLFSGLAFAGLIYTMYLQREDLRLQSTELELTRKEIAGQREQLELQNKTLSIQKFENTFFQTLRLLNELVGSISAEENRTGEARIRHEGDQAIRYIYKMYFLIFKQRKKEQIPVEDVLSVIKKLLSYHPEFIPFFNTTRNILEFLANSTIENKSLYINIFKAQLSDSQLALIFYYSFFPESIKLQSLLIEFNFFENLNHNYLASPDHLHKLPFILREYRVT